MNNSFWRSKKILVTGGASFIGSHLVDTLISKNIDVRVIDDLSSGNLKNIEHHITNKNVEFIKGDLRETKIAKNAVGGVDLIFHLAGDHGGRGYVDFHQAGPATNLLLDGNLFWQAHKASVDKIVFASSGCVYPNYLQINPRQKLYLKENQAGPPYDADNMYGWAKLMSEMALCAYTEEFGIKSASCRFFTVYGPRSKEDHAITAMIARAFIKQDPFIVWGNGRQVRNWTYVDDIISGFILAAEKIDDGTSVNLGSEERITVLEAVKMIFEYVGYTAKIELHPEMPTGPANRVANNKLAKELLGWEPRVKFSEGLESTIEWYFANKDRQKVAENLEKILIERNKFVETASEKGEKIIREVNNEEFSKYHQTNK